AAALAEDAERIAAELDERRAAVAKAQRAERELAPAIEAADAARSTAEKALAAAEVDLRAAERDQQTWSARVEALTLALDASRARAGVERLGGVVGVVGTLLELVEVDAGWQAAFEAAVGEALAAVVVDDVDAARRALAHLKSEVAAPSAVGGAVLPLDAVLTPEADRGAVEALVAVCPAARLRSHVRSSRPGMAGFLDSLLARVVAVDGGWEQTLDVALAHPGLVVVNREGDRFSATGWRAGTSATGATGAALEQARAEAAAS
ncbi:MAG: hypothetical protein CYG61_05365, partial [Actinobacteria bacterium]